MRFTLQSNLHLTNVQVILSLVEVYEGLRVFKEGYQLRKDIEDAIGEIIQQNCKVLWMVRRDEGVELGLNFKGWDFAPVITVAIDGTVSSEDGVNKEGFSEILRKPYVGKINEGGLKMKTKMTKVTKVTKAEKEMADKKVNDAIAVLRQVEMEFNEAEREYQAALDRLSEAQEERDRLCEKEE